MSKLNLLFLGSGNAFAAQGRAFSSFLLNGRYLFDCGPTVLQQLNRAGVSSHDVEAVFISHFHGDHFFGLPFLLLDSKYGGRTRDLTIVGPPGIEARTRELCALGYPNVCEPEHYAIRYVETTDGMYRDICDANVSTGRVQHVDEFESYAYRVEVGGRSVAYSGDTTLCEGLLRIVDGADVVVTECSCESVSVHLGPEGVAEVAKRAGGRVIVTHLDGHDHPSNFEGLIVAEDLKRYEF